MDVNGTKLHILLSQHDWLGGRDAPLPASTHLEWDAAHASLRLEALLYVFPRPPGDMAPVLEQRRGAAYDRYGNWYWIDEARTTIRIRRAHGRAAEHFWSFADLVAGGARQEQPGDFAPDTPVLQVRPVIFSGLAVTEHQYLVVGVLDPDGTMPPGLCIFDLHAGGAPVQVSWPPDVPFAPFDMAAAPDGGVWILDRGSAAAPQARYWWLDRYFRLSTREQDRHDLAPPRQDDFHAPSSPPREQPGRWFPTGIALHMASPISALHPISIEALPDGSVLILDHPPDQTYSVVYRYLFGQQRGSVALDRDVLGEDMEVPKPGGLRGHDLAFVPDPGSDVGQGPTGTLYVVDSEGNQAFAFDFKAFDQTFGLDLQKRYFPMRLFTGKALVAAGRNVYYDSYDAWRQLVERPRPRYEPEGRLITRVFDSREPECVWHRVLVDACMPAGTKVVIETRVAEHVSVLERMPWQQEPALYRRQSSAELPYYRPFPQADRQDVGTWEVLLQRARGRYIQLRLTLIGTGRTTPRLKALRLYYPRFSYLREYLPALYQDDDTSAQFLDRFLANVEGTYTALEGRIAEAQALFDVRTVESEYLEWLAGWFGVLLDPAWDDARRRLFLSHAVELFQQRGTVPGLIRAVRLATDPCPSPAIFTEDVSNYGDVCRTGPRFVRHAVRIVERFLTRRVPGVIYGDPTEETGPGFFPEAAAWTPSQGATWLHERYRDFLRQTYASIQEVNAAWSTTYEAFTDIVLSPIRPAHAGKAADWLRYVRTQIGLNYTIVDPATQPDVLQHYRVFLARRYKRISRLNAAYQLTLTSFQEVELPQEDAMPPGGAPLQDWMQFVSLALPITRHAHRFIVLVPTTLTSDTAVQQQHMELVRRIVALEKPAHTNFEVRQYWAAFRVGEARIGYETLLDMDSRFTALVLGQGYLAEGFVAPEHPWDVAERTVVGRDQLDAEENAP